jgi:hypothetical protein
MDETQLQDFARRISKEADPSKNQDLIPAATVVVVVSSSTIPVSTDHGAGECRGL